MSKLYQSYCYLLILISSMQFIIHFDDIGRLFGEWDYLSFCSKYIQFHSKLALKHYSSLSGIGLETLSILT